MSDKWEPRVMDCDDEIANITFRCRKCNKWTSSKSLYKGFCSQECMDNFTEDDFSEEQYELGADFDREFTEEFQ
jgi:hypothetical protein